VLFLELCMVLYCAHVLYGTFKASSILKFSCVSNNSNINGQVMSQKLQASLF
jgi:hypothetical protein